MDMGRLATGIGPPILTHPLGLHPGLGNVRRQPPPRGEIDGDQYPRHQARRTLAAVNGKGEVPMGRLMWIFHALISTTLMGVAITAVLVAELSGWKPVAMAAVVGFVAALPISYLIAKKVESLPA
jgi:hypothetical protein